MPQFRAMVKARARHRSYADLVEHFAEKKLPDLNAHDVDQAAKIIAGTARSMGVEVK